MSRVKVGAICMNSTPDVESNLANAERLVRQAAAEKCNWIVLPEVFPYIGPDTTTFDIYEKIHLSVLAKMSQLAQDLKVTLFAGTIPRPSAIQKKLLNVFTVFDPTGQVIAEYDKTHLFELRGEDGEILVSEKKVFQQGAKTLVVNIDGFNVGLAVCYDIRFLSFFETMGKDQLLDVVMLPSAFTFETGKAHWNLLLRGRALDLQCYVVGSAQGGIHFGNRRSFGHALIADPWAEILDETSETEGIAYAFLDTASIRTSRTRLQQRMNRRNDLYN